ncbi:hypothetical protein KP509_35G009600 [Ceratopteris richardii]|uniref:Inhibitor I9 domain-containing protein n=1 Tax=Ceratopteris richardii TaxID=49495 RepID=A0A8T2QEN4_CERRI|nr:hypothetical protein KP509_35G009600 [Ceratopteris richardii]
MEEAKVYIVYMERQERASPETLESSHLQILTSLLGSEEAAMAALLYSYKTTVNGFSAKLTSAQAEELRGKPGVLQVTESQTFQLQGETATTKPNVM